MMTIHYFNLGLVYLRINLNFRFLLLTSTAFFGQLKVIYELALLSCNIAFIFFPKKSDALTLDQAFIDQKRFKIEGFEID